MLGRRRRKELQTILDRKFNYRSYQDDDVEVCNGGPTGRGVFAVRQFLPGTLVVEVRGQMLSQKKYDASCYVMELNKRLYMEPDIPAAFSNHSCNPNCELIQLTKHSMGIVAICNIEPGTEICYDYRWPAIEWIPECHCGAPNCRGWVVADDEVGKMRKISKKLRKKKKKR